MRVCKGGKLHCYRRPTTAPIFNFSFHLKFKVSFIFIFGRGGGGSSHLESLMSRMGPSLLPLSLAHTHTHAQLCRSCAGSILRQMLIMLQIESRRQERRTTKESGWGLIFLLCPTPTSACLALPPPPPLPPATPMNKLGKKTVKLSSTTAVCVWEKASAD